MGRKSSTACRVDRCRATAELLGLCQKHADELPPLVRTALITLGDRVAAVEATLRDNYILLDRQSMKAALRGSDPPPANS